MRLYYEEESLTEAKKADGVDDGEGEHVPGDHLEDHGDKGPGELDGPAEEHEVKPGSRHGEDEESFLYRAAQLLLLTILGDGFYSRLLLVRMKKLSRMNFVNFDII